MKCPKCSSDNIVKNGFKQQATGLKQQYLCRECKHQFIEPKVGLPLILIFDIETAPIKGYFWNTGKAYVSYDNIIEDWFILSWSAKWLFDSGIISDIVTPEEAVNCDDSRIMKGIWDLFNDADIVVAHNGDRFDVRKLNTRFIMNGFKPPLPYQSIDTLKILRKDKTGFAFSSNRLDFIGQLTRNKGKIKTDFALWKRCCGGDAESLAFMEKYNREDVALLEEVYLWLRPWIKSHPNVGLYMDTIEPVCTNCGSSEIVWGGHYVTPAGKFSAFRCNCCGAIGRCKTTALSDNKRKNLSIPVAR